jgi:trk system potassium uptake protein TrkH
MNIKFILYVLGTLLMIEGSLMLLPFTIALLYGEGDMWAFLFSAAIAAGAGSAFRYSLKNCSKEISKREGHIIVCLVWVVYAFFGALPFMLSGYVPSLTDAFFEAMSGFTTTGGTILKDIEALPHGLLFWRALSHFTGGIGILVLGIAILPIFGTGSMLIYQMETSTASVGGKLSPRIKDTVKNIFSIYLILTLVCILFYLPEMGIFDSVCHAFSTMATGGFSTRNASMGDFSAYSQYVSIFFMLLGGTNFTLIFYLWKRDFSKIYQNDEYRFYLLIVLVSSLFICTCLLVHGYGVEKSIRESLFHVVSILTTTGYVVSDYLLWMPPLWFILFLFGFIGGCAGSTTGGLKVIRVLLVLRMIPVQFKKIIHQNAIIQVKLNRQNVPEDRMFRTLAFLMIFFCVFLIGVFVLMISGLDFSSAVGTSIACLGNSGPGLGIVGSAGNYGEVSAFGKWVCSFLMVFGRLELYSVLILFSPAFWRKP